MLSAAHRLRSSGAFTDVVRRGRRAGQTTLTAHLLSAPDDGVNLPPQAGLVISKAVGGSVVRHAVARKLRHLLRERMPALGDGTLLVVRAAPAAATATSAELAGDLDRALRRLTGRPDAPAPAR